MTAIFTERAAIDLSLTQLLRIFSDKQVKTVYYKILAPNDNSKNQIYSAAHLDELKFLPEGHIESFKSDSSKSSKTNVRFLLSFSASWIDSSGHEFEAPDAKMIYYPQYPEVRFSGFLNGTRFDNSGWFDPYKHGRDLDRVLFIGVAKGKAYLWLAIPNSTVSKEILARTHQEYTAIFNQISTSNEKRVDSKRALLSELQRIHLKDWIPSKIMHGIDNVTPYLAQNGGGYTLEAELGIPANGDALPDFMDWEVKQYAVSTLGSSSSKPLTLMTPEPDSGIYKIKGFISFMKSFGYPDKEIDDRLNFNGKHVCNEKNLKTKLTLRISGYDIRSSKITDSQGYIGIETDSGIVAASWSFAKMLEHWRKKHFKAAYVQSISKEHDALRYYKYGSKIQMFEGTDFSLLLNSILRKYAYYDPGCKLELVSTNPKGKYRNQFRIPTAKLDSLYHRHEIVDLKDL